MRDPLHDVAPLQVIQQLLGQQQLAFVLQLHDPKPTHHPQQLLHPHVLQNVLLLLGRVRRQLALGVVPEHGLGENGREELVDGKALLGAENLPLTLAVEPGLGVDAGVLLAEVGLEDAVDEPGVDRDQDADESVDDVGMGEGSEVLVDLQHAPAPVGSGQVGVVAVVEQM